MYPKLDVSIPFLLRSSDLFVFSGGDSKSVTPNGFMKRLLSEARSLTCLIWK